MAKCHRNNVDSLIFHRIPSASSSSSTSGNSSSGSAFRRMIFHAISCGRSSRYRRELREDEDDEVKTYFTKTTSDSKPATIGKDDSASKPEKLSDLLNLAVIETCVEKKKKEETLEIMKRVVRGLQAEAECGGAEEKLAVAGSEVRLLAKDATEARVTLAMFGAILPLVSMINDSPIEDSQIASLYALLNLGIGNDANKAAIVKAGAVHKILKLIESSKPPNQAITERVGFQQTDHRFLGCNHLPSKNPGRKQQLTS